jgi:hypothetical protein
VEVWFPPFLNLALNGGECVASYLDLFTSREFYGLFIALHFLPAHSRNKLLIARNRVILDKLKLAVLSKNSSQFVKMEN